MAKRVKLNSITALQIGAASGAILGLLLGIAYAFGGLMIDTLVSIGSITSSETPGLSYGTFLAFGALIGMPIIFAIPGLIIGALGAMLYNLVTKPTGT